MSDRAVVITGAAGGIGEALCEMFFQCDWYVIATDNVELCESKRHTYVPIDLAQLCSDDEYARTRIDDIRGAIAHRTLGALVNNAAVQVVAPIEELDAGTWRTTLDTNLLAPAILTRALLSELEAGRGSVVNIASIHARLTKPWFVSYATSKAGLVGLTRALAVELGGRVSVNAICPAAIETPMLKEGLLGSAYGSESLTNLHPSGCIGRPDEVAALAYYLVGNPSMFLTGSVIDLDGAIGSRLHERVI